MRMNFLEKHFVVRDLFLRSWRPFVWIALVASLPYVQILTFSEYTYYDDHFLIVENFDHINKLSNLGHAFIEDVSHQGQGGNLYRPLLTLSLFLSAQISGTQPFGYHLIDILFHCISCCLLFSTLQTLGFKKFFSFCGTLIFCVHPALTQAIAWIAGRNDSLLTIFILLSFITYTIYCSTSFMRWYFLHLLCFACAMFTKESAIMLPLLTLLYSFSFRKEKILSFTTVFFLAGWGIVLFNWHILRSASMVVPVGNMLQAMTTVLSNLWIAVYYLGKIFWPFNLAFAPISSDIHVTVGIAAVVLLFLALFLSERRDWKYIIFGIMWFLAFLVPTFYYNSGVHTPPKFYEHRIYLPFMGILFSLLSISYTNKLGYLKRFFPPVVFLTLFFLGWFSYSRTFNFKNSLTLSEYDASTSPSDPRRYSDIQRMAIPEILDQEIKTIQGRSHLQESSHTPVSKEELWKIIDDLRNELKSNRNDPSLHHALAIAYFSRGFYLSSEENFFTAIQYNPQDATIPYNLGILYYSAQPKMKAEKAWQEALRLDPTMGNAHLNLSFLYYESGQYQSAWDHCQKALQLGIGVPSSFVNEIRKRNS
jgi:hypothetical protein